MNRTPTPSETNSAKSPPQAVFNYAEAAKRSSQIQDQQPSPRTQSPSSTSGNNNDSNKKGNHNTNGAVNGTATTPSAVNTQQPPQPQASFASTVASATNSPSNKSASPAAKNARNASVQLPRAPPTDAAPIQFGSINQGTDSPAQSSSNKNGDVAPVLKSSEVTFGSLPATDASSGTPSQSQNHQQQQQRRDSTQSNHSEQGSPHYNNNNNTSHNNNTSNNNNNNNNNNTSRHYRHYNQNKHQGMPHSPNMQNSQPYVPHHQKKPISPHMPSAPSPNVTGQNMPMPPNWGSPSPVHRQHQPPYYVPPNFEGQQHHYYQPYNMGGYVGQGGNNAPPAPGASQPYVPPQRNNKAIRIINPETMTEVKAEAVASSSSSTANSSTKESTTATTATTTTKPNEEQRTTPTIKKEELKSSTSSTPAPAPSSTSTSTSNAANSPSKAIPIVDPAIKDREAREKREREEAAQKAKEEEERKVKEEAERKEREEKERLEAEQKAKEEAERKAKEEAERIEAEEKKAKEEAERKAKEEQEKKEAEEKKAKEEAERKAKEEREKKEAEEKKAKEVAEQQEAEKKEAAAAAAAAATTPARLDMEAVSKTSATNTLTATPTSVTPASAKPTPSNKTTRTIEDPSTIQYPATVKAPFGSKDPNGKITYEPNFLLQFAPLCLESSEDLSQFQNIAEEQQQNDRPRSMSRRQNSERGRGGPRTPTMDMGMFRHGSRDGRMEMGKFAGGRPLSHRAGSGSHALPPAGAPGSPGGMQREGSHGGRTRSGRGGKGRHGKGGDNQEKQERQQQGAPTIPPEQVKPLEQSQNRWVPLALRKQREAEKAAESDLLSDEVIIRKVKSLLNKLTLEKFDSIAGQIWEYAKQSEKEEDGRALKVVIQLTFDKACDEPAFASMWAQLCRKMYDSITDDIKDVNVKDKEGNTVSGVNLLRKYLLNRCQHDFERGWKMQIPEVDQNNPDMMSDEYYAAVKAKRQGLGLVVFIGELFKRQMLTDRIMLQCLTRLCDNPKEVGDEETETMVKLITTIGKPLDISNRKNKEWVDIYFERMKEMMESPNLSSRIKFMILDLFDLRKNKWVSRRGNNQVAPTTIAQVHEQAQKAKIEEKEAMKRTTSSRGSLPHPMSRAGSHRGAGGRDLQREGSSGSNAASTTVDGWSTVGSGSPGGSSKGTRANELANFGKTDRSKARSSVLGPGNSPFASLHRASKAGGDQKSSPSESRSSSANMFSALGGEGGDDGHNESHQEENKSEEKQDNKQEDSSEATSTTTTSTSSTPVATDSNTPQED